MHIGAVRIILTLLGRKGLPVTARIALLNTIYKQYEHAVIGTCISTLHTEREDEIPTIVQIPKQLPIEKLKERDGSIKTIYEAVTESEASFNTPPVFQELMIRPVTSEDDITIHSFQADRSPVYTDKINGHFIWDADPNMCDADFECKTCLKARNDSCTYTLFHGFFNYDQDFPSLELTSNLERNLFSRPFIQTIEVLPNRYLKQPSRAEQVLNWQSHNAKVQNRVLNSIDQKIDRVTYHVSQHDHHLQSLDVVLRDMFTDLQSRIAKLDADLHHYINCGYFGPEFDRKEREIRQLREQLEQMNKDQLNIAPSSYIPKPYPYTQSLIFPTQSPPYSPSIRLHNSSQYFKSIGELF
ncbi:hypothetical protein Ddye_023970 [Dipteronia dyeriana]|uniref:Uncharacterized protein n=1 Tax=Dipteronia dyeriana TaxID=168575 RepID=A0AAD9TUF7_9ROSI|nr:hypothetical protein Ddye_023970 [Dipteronia dyeriana]